MPILVTLFGIVMLVRLEQHVNESSPIRVTLLGICFDAGHSNLCAKGYLHEGNNSVHRAVWQKVFNKEPDWDDQICEKMLPEIVTCHLHDNDGGKDQHLLPGKGNIDWDRISGLLKQAPKLKYIQSEVSVVPNRVSLQELRETFERMFQ